MADTITFTAVIESAGGGGAFVSIPFDVEKAFGRKRVKVQATIDGVHYRGSIMNMGGPCPMLGVLKQIRAAIGKDIGDVVEVTVVEDTEPRVVDVPPDLAAAITADTAAAATFERLSYTHRKEYVQWVQEAKKAETRERRIAKAVTMLAEGRRIS